MSSGPEGKKLPPLGTAKGPMKVTHHEKNYVDPIKQINLHCYSANNKIRHELLQQPYHCWNIKICGPNLVSKFLLQLREIQLLMERFRSLLHTKAFLKKEEKYTKRRSWFDNIVRGTMF
jgi:hypothetical protein